MASRSTTPDRGALYDRFPEQSESPHGGNLFDEGFTLQNLTQANGRLHDIFGASPDGGGNGQRHDQFGWRELPRLHGSYFDEDFRSEMGFDGDDGHTSWFDVFRPGTGVRYLSQGREVEGIVSQVSRDHAIVTTGGKSVEVGLSQFLAYRSPSQENASADIPASDAEAPSAHSSSAHGAGRTDGPGYGQPWDATPQGQATEPRQGVPGGAMDAVDHVKTHTQSLVSKMMPSWSRFGGNAVLKTVDSAQTAVQGDAEKKAAEWCPSCKAIRKEAKHGECPGCKGKLVAKTSDVTDVAKTAAEKPLGSWQQGFVDRVHAAHATSGRAGCAWHTTHGLTGKAKSYEGHYLKSANSLVTSGHLKRIGNAGVSGKAMGFVPAGASEEREVAKTTVDQLADIAKAFGTPADPTPGGQTVTISTEAKAGTHSATSDPASPEVPEREHAETDHHESGHDRETCPHCGEALALNDERTKQGQPAHKCLGSSLDLLKAAVA